MDYSLTYHIIARVHSARTNVYTLNMPQCRDSVVRKICIKKRDGYVFILNNILCEKRSLEKAYLVLLEE